ncbi:hypothetical protein [Pseudoxanthomonas daejeonensis]|uniref:Uncharacterized protein n=1 Tax=Pseudoxanthomonas daejeonensis TaxID=266062 RepID=A0ABQ6Z973_9GAMM|nr:hypothetical protein [Pseudoxanthomonas daejeonensis]KAF1696017.1 hypothetical protein CSC65_05840 [Pseudoxanthomonas daejeonensis]
MEDALPLSEALEAAIRYRIVCTEDGFLIEAGDADDHLHDKQTALHYARRALEDPDYVVDIVV